MDQPLARLTQDLKRLSQQGDLTCRLNPDDYGSDLAPLAHEIVRFADHVRETLAVLETAVTRASIKEALGVVQFRQVSDQLREQTSGVEQVSTGMMQMNQAVDQVAQSASTSASLTTVLKATAESGLGPITNTLHQSAELAARTQAANQAVRNLIESAQAARGILTTIERITKQTQLLAINAAIEAAHAGEKGRGFAVVASEVRRLSDQTARSTQEIAELVAKIGSTATAAADSMVGMEQHALDVARDGEQAGKAFEQMHQLIESAALESQNIAAAAQESASITEEVTATTETLLCGIASTSKSITITRDDSFSTELEEAQSFLGQFRLNGRFDQVRSLAERGGSEVEAVVTRALDSGRIQLEQLWDTAYRTAGPADLQHLFDCKRVGANGFTPPKYTLSYDRQIDRELIDRLDGYMALDRDFAYFSVTDLNGFGLALARRLCQDWTGDPARDLIGNRVKRLFEDPLGIRSARVGLGAAAAKLPPRSSIEALRRAGAPLEGAPDRSLFLVQTYARDTGEVVKDLALPLYARGRRWGTLRVGYKIT